MDSAKIDNSDKYNEDSIENNGNDDNTGNNVPHSMRMKGKLWFQEKLASQYT